MQPVPLEGSQGEVRAALAIRRETLHRLAMHFGLPPSELLQRVAHGGLGEHGPAIQSLAAQRQASWWLAQRDRAPEAMLAALGAPPPAPPRARAPVDIPLPPGHPPVAVAVVSRSDGVAPHLAQAALRRMVPRAMEVVRAAEHPMRGAAPGVEEAVRALGIDATWDEAASLERASAAEVVVQVGDVPRLPESYRGKRIQLWRATPERPASLAEVKFVYGQLSEQAYCLVDAYRRRLHTPE